MTCSPHAIGRPGMPRAEAFRVARVRADHGAQEKRRPRRHAGRARKIADACFALAYAGRAEHVGA